MTTRQARAVAGIAFAGMCTTAVLAAQTPSPAPLATASPAGSTNLPSLTPSPASTASGSPVPSAIPSASASPVPTPTVLMLAPDAAPQILWVALSSTAPRAGDVVTGVVLTSSNVASVEARVEGRAGTFIIPLTKTDVGHFAGSCRVPEVPLFMPHSFVVRFIAHNTAGVTAERTVAMRVR